ncbi:MAG TPA: heavy-metal-associated domain-containing protein [Coriobacteriia bacterium]
MTSVDLKTTGMHCSSCSMLIEMAVGDLPGVAAVKADFGRNNTHVEFDPATISLEEITAAITEAGYTAESGS